jgi:hypothetical protein
MEHFPIAVKTESSPFKNQIFNTFNFMKPNFTLNWVEAINKKAYRVANILTVIGIGLLVGVYFLEPASTERLIVLIVALLFLASRFILGFFLDSTRKAGALYFFESELQLIENKKVIETIPYSSMTNFDFSIIEFEGETKGVDMLRSSSRMHVRSGADNLVCFDASGKTYNLQFKLATANGKTMAHQNLSSLKEKLGGGK